jgi:hypothetical protein
MTQPQVNSSTMKQAVEVLTENGLEGMVGSWLILDATYERVRVDGARKWI